MGIKELLKSDIKVSIMQAKPAADVHKTLGDMQCWVYARASNCGKGCFWNSFLSCPQAAAASEPLVTRILFSTPASFSAAANLIAAFLDGLLKTASAIALYGIKLTCDRGTRLWSRAANSLACKYQPLSQLNARAAHSFLHSDPH